MKVWWEKNEMKLKLKKGTFYKSSIYWFCEINFKRKIKISSEKRDDFHLLRKLWKTSSCQEKLTTEWWFKGKKNWREKDYNRTWNVDIFFKLKMNESISEKPTKTEKDRN